MTTQPGWYRDPAPANPASPDTVRYWDGNNWTGQVKSASKQERQAWRHEVAAQQREYAAQYHQAAQAGGYPAGALPAAALRLTTPDGERLAGWWARVGAVVLDSIVTGAVGLTLGWSFLTRLVDEYSHFVQQTLDAAEAGTPAPDANALMSAVSGPLLSLTAILFAVQLVYGVGFLKAFAATPGKMALGLRVRLRDRPGPLPWGTVLTRWFTQNAGSFLQFIPMISIVGSAYALINGLWPLWDSKRQALHDKAARTNVVRVRG